MALSVLVGKFMSIMGMNLKSVAHYQNRKKIKHQMKSPMMTIYLSQGKIYFPLGKYLFLEQCLPNPNLPHLTYRKKNLQSLKVKKRVNLRPNQQPVQPVKQRHPQRHSHLQVVNCLPHPVHPYRAKKR